jgi:hypothetical protein
MARKQGLRKITGWGEHPIARLQVSSSILRKGKVDESSKLGMNATHFPKSILIHES